jgi:7,8-dihydropterin-6-yl-methyl-4-(beta-D-ribofuranosyl)aminobenzene 5'-phosphate synthase
MFQADSVEIRMMVDNWVDMLLTDTHLPHCSIDIQRFGLMEHFDPKLLPPQAENGLSMLVKIHRGRTTTTVLFDVGLTGSVLAHNWGSLGEDPSSVGHIVISHGHPDHYGGVYGALRDIGRRTPVITHGDAFLPRTVVAGDGRASAYYNARFDQGDLVDAGGRVMATREPLELGWGVRTTGEIPRKNDFEGTPRPAEDRGAGLYQLRADGTVVIDDVMDEQALIIDVKDRGLVVLTGCSHAGVVNTLHRAVQICGEKPIAAVMGGFHLGFPTTPTENIGRTIDAFSELDVQGIIPMHCTGLTASAAIKDSLSARFVQPAVGTTVRIGEQ